MKRIAIVAAIILSTYVAISYAQGFPDTVQHKNCKICGMNREEFGHSRLLITYSEEKTVGTCSIRCAALDFSLNMGRVPQSIMAGDYNSRELMDAEKAYWVIGGKKEGVMSMRGKWAFKKKAEAERFRARNGGRIGAFQDALRASFEDLHKDLKAFWDSLKKQDR